MDAVGYFEKVVSPTFCETLESKFSLHKSVACAILLYHMADYLIAGQGDAVRTRVFERLQDELPEFAVLKTVANVTKHFQLDRGQRKGLRAGAITRSTRLPMLAQGLPLLTSNGHLVLGKKPISISVDGQVLDVESVLRTAFKYFESNLGNLIDYASAPKP